MTATYVHAARAAFLRHAPTRHGGWPDELVDLFTLAVLTSGTQAECEDVHDAWAVWTARQRPGHRSLIPFDDLAADAQQLDEPYRDAIRAAAESLRPALPPGTVELPVWMRVGDGPERELGRLEVERSRPDVGAEVPRLLREAADAYDAERPGRSVVLGGA